MKKTLSILLLSALAVTTVPSMAQNIYKNKSYQWKGNEIIQGKFKAKALSPTQVTSNYVPQPSQMEVKADMIDRQNWTLKKDISALPQYTADNVLENALYNMALEESILAIEPDSTFRTGVFWGGVWTRDVSYSILHSLAQLHPDICKKSLLHKINANNRIIQDTGTGGAWPCSTDRMTWVLAAWEVYKVTGDKEWLDRIFPVIKNSVEDDHIVAYDPATKLMKGETSWLDWREQEYPIWAQPADIYNSEAMNTTAVHYQTIRILSEICTLEGQEGLAKRYAGWANDLKEGMNKQLWMENMGEYAIYLYGRNNLVVHPQQEILGESFAILWDIASPERQKTISEHMISEEFGTPDLYPNLKDQYPYHNDAMWPFTQGYWMKAAAKTGNEAAVLHSIATLTRCSALFLTNQENMVIYNGDYNGLPINSPRQLWSVAASAAIVPNIYFGIQYETNGISFSPMVPKVLKGNRHLTNFKYRQTVLDLSISGFGNTIKSFKLDGVETKPYINGNLTGAHTVVIELDNVQPAPMNFVVKANAYQPNCPKTTLSGNKLSWEAIETATEYILLKDGKESKRTSELSTTLEDNAEYAIIPVNAEGVKGYMSEPVHFYSSAKTYVMPNGKVATITRNENILLTIPVEVSKTGKYAIDWKYANGNGPVNTENKCATRVLKVNGETAGVSVFPHRGTGEWDNWGWSNAVVTRLKAGKNIITLEFCDTVENMNITENKALLELLRITPME